MSLTDGRQHSGCDRVVKKACEVVYESTDADCLISQSSSRCFGNDGITDWTDGNHVDERRKHQQNTDCQGFAGAARKSKTTNDDQDDEHDCHTAHINSCSTKVREQEPTDDTPDDVARGQGDVDVKGLDF